MASQNKNQTDQVKVNESIRAKELRVISAEGDNYGVLSRDEALAKAREAGFDLIEISPNANPPVAKIMDYGKFRYEQSKKARDMRSGARATETKVIQIRPNTGDHDLELKAKKASEWLAGGDRVKVELYLKGRSKFMEKDFLGERLERMLKLVTIEYKVAEEARPGPKGLYTIIERSKKK